MLRNVAVTAVVAGLPVSLVLADARSVQMQARLVRQTGMLPGTVTDVDASATYAAVPGEVVRFELQYRMLDLDLTDAYVPAGLAATTFDLRSDTAGYRFRRAQLSRFEAQLAAADPPAPIDASGLPIGPASVRQGLHSPFRVFTNQNDNSFPANGTFLNGIGTPPTEGDGILSITPVVLSQPNQGNANLGIDNNAWYGLYSFDVVVGTEDTIIRSIILEDPSTRTAYAYWRDGFAQPLQRQGGFSTTYAITVPAPGIFGLVCGVGAIVSRRRRS